MNADDVQQERAEEEIGDARIACRSVDYSAETRRRLWSTKRRQEAGETIAAASLSW